MIAAHLLSICKTFKLKPKLLQVRRWQCCLHVGIVASLVFLKSDILTFTIVIYLLFIFLNTLPHMLWQLLLEFYLVSRMEDRERLDNEGGWKEKVRRKLFFCERRKLFFKWNYFVKGKKVRCKLSFRRVTIILVKSVLKERCRKKQKYSIGIIDGCCLTHTYIHIFSIIF